MAAEGVTGQEDHVQDQDQRTDRHAEMFGLVGIDEPQAVPGIAGKDDDEDDGQVHKIAVDVLDDEREITFAEVFFAGFADGAVRRVGPERLVIRATIIVAGETETAWSPQDEEGTRENQPVRPPRRFREPGMRRDAENLRGKEG